jgi:hypothetical protein
MGSGRFPLHALNVYSYGIDSFQETTQRACLRACLMQHVLLEGLAVLALEVVEAC